MNRFRRQGRRGDASDYREALRHAYPPDAEADAALDRLIARIEELTTKKGTGDDQA